MGRELSEQSRGGIAVERQAAPGRYAFSNLNVNARRRLTLLESWHDPATITRLQALRVGPGWRCLEAGAGAGSIARWFCDQVGAEGCVVAVDLEPELLEGLEGAPNLEIHRLDLVRDPLPEGEFDLVHTRAVLMHLREREEVIRRLVACLRPGGWVLLEEGDMYPVMALGSPIYRDVMAGMAAGLSRFGMAAEWARNLPSLLAGMDLDDVGGDSWCPMFPGRSPMAEFWKMTWLEAKESLADEHMSDRQLAQAFRALDDPGQWFPGLAMVAAWGRRREP
jgi:SAM-dependent methyltransferase